MSLYPAPDVKKRAHAAARARMQKLARLLSIPTHARKISSNPGGIAVWGEVSLWINAPEPTFPCIYVSFAVDPNAEGFSYWRFASIRDPFGTSPTCPNQTIPNWLTLPELARWILHATARDRSNLHECHERHFNVGRSGNLKGRF